MNSITGWLIDAWSSEETISLWIKNEKGENVFLHDSFYPEVFIRCHSQKGKAFLWKLVKKGIVSFPQEVRKKELWTGQDIPVYSALIHEQHIFRKIISNADRYKDEIEFFNTDILPVHAYFIKKDLFPLCRIRIQAGSGMVNTIISESIQHAVEHDYPDLSSVYISTRYGKDIAIGNDNPLLISTHNRTTEAGGSKKQIISCLNDILLKEDPDIVYSKSGDEFLLPWLFQTARQLKKELALDRNQVNLLRNTSIRKKSFYSYGRVIYKTTPFPLFGRLHIDKGQSFFYSESDIEGVLEMSRLSRLTIQKLSRSSPGSAMSAMEDETALKKNILIPRTKGKAADVKPLKELLKTDQGGMSFRPPAGIHENVTELDFRSLYPNLMKLHNISGETVNCKCCSPGKPVPATPYHTCLKREGIVPAAITMLLERRDSIKKMIETGNYSEQDLTRLELKSTAIKWCLVTSFGYTGYKNAKYGKREAHESITAWGRFSIQTAKEIAEKHGFELLHSLTDSMWLENRQNNTNISELTEEVYNKTSILLHHEGTYSWIVFPFSKTKNTQSVATRYFGRFTDGKMKIRGMLSRKKDTPEIIREFQNEIYNILSQIREIGRISDFADTIEQIKQDYLKRISSNSIPAEKLVIRKTVSKSPQEYSGNSPSAVISRLLQEEGKNIHPGESIKYYAANVSAKNPEERYLPYYKKMKYDQKYYQKMIVDACDEILEIFRNTEDLITTGGLFE